MCCNNMKKCCCFSRTIWSCVSSIDRSANYSGGYTTVPLYHCGVYSGGHTCHSNHTYSTSSSLSNLTSLNLSSSTLISPSSSSVNHIYKMSANFHFFLPGMLYTSLLHNWFLSKVWPGLILMWNGNKTGFLCDALFILVPWKCDRSHKLCATKMSCLCKIFYLICAMKRSYLFAKSCITLRRLLLYCNFSDITRYCSYIPSHTQSRKQIKEKNQNRRQDIVNCTGPSF